jgi:hypothetical protein
MIIGVRADQWGLQELNVSFAIRSNSGCWMRFVSVIFSLLLDGLNLLLSI